MQNLMRTSMIMQSVRVQFLHKEDLSTLQIMNYDENNNQQAKSDKY